MHCDRCGRPDDSIALTASGLLCWVCESDDDEQRIGPGLHLSSSPADPGGAACALPPPRSAAPERIAEIRALLDGVDDWSWRRGHVLDSGLRPVADIRWSHPLHAQHVEIVGSAPTLIRELLDALEAAP